MKIFLDMDGVLVDFIGGANHAHGKEDPFKITINRGTYTVERLWGMTPKQFWEPLNSIEFWEGLKKTEECDAIVQLAIDMVGFKNVCILTAPSLYEGCIIGKQRWIKRELPKFETKLIFAAFDMKQLIAGSGKILIDDRDSNIDEWEAAGGYGILVPRPWNVAHEESDIALPVIQAELGTILSMEADHDSISCQA